MNLLFNLIGGLALFLYGIKLLSEGLRSAAGNKIKSIFESITNRPIKGIFAGALVTALVQCSSITTVTIVGLVNAGLMTLPQSITVIMGANIGTTVTAQLIAFKLSKYALPIIAIGVAFLFLAKKKKYSYVAQIFLGFGLLFLGMSTMSAGAAPLKELPFFMDMLIKFGEITILGVIAGAVFTGVIQSSSATTALVIAMAMENVIGLKAAIALVIGANIGTCVTALLASISTSISAKRAAAAHVLFNITGALVFVPLINVLTRLASVSSSELPRQIANAHTIFNITISLMLITFIPVMVFVVKKIVPGKEIKIEDGAKFLDKRLLNTPEVALAQAKKELARMAKMTLEMLGESIEAFLEGKNELIQLVTKKEEVVDTLHMQIEYYLKKITEEKSTKKETHRIVANLLHIIHDIERVGDHAMNITELAEKTKRRKACFSEHAKAELKMLAEEAKESYRLAIEAMNKKDKKFAMDAAEIEEKIDGQVELFEANHIERLKKGKCNPELGVFYVKAIRNLERISDHAKNIAKTVILDF